LARGFTDTFSGIALRSILGFMAAQIIGALLGTLLGKFFYSSKEESANV
jgi:glycerol uptake facilitator-like aquaporin